MPAVKKPKRNRQPTYIKAWREYRHLTQERAAERIGIATTTFGRIEAGKVPYNQDFLEQCADALSCTVSDLLNRHPEIENEIDKLRVILATASKADQKRIVALAKTLIENNG